MNSHGSFPSAYCYGMAIAALLLVGCDQLKFPTSKREQAQEAEAAGEYPKAVALYEESFAEGNRGEVHYAMAMIYEDKLSDPVSALHHFRRSVKSDPDGPRAADAKRAEQRVQMLIAATLGGGAPISRAEAVRLKNENLALRKQVADLKKEATASGKSGDPAKAATASAKTSPSGSKPPPATAAAEKAGKEASRTYVVQKGDTLAQISRKFYKTPNRWKDIADANHNQLSGGSELQPGMKLIIP